MPGSFQHISVLPKETVDALAIKPNGVYVDGTLGGGGHSSLILECLTGNARLIGIDRDEDALAAASIRCDSPRFVTARGNFHDMSEILHGMEISEVDGVLLDLGVSSYQLDTGERGFSYRLDGPLDMRMDNRAELNAHTIINTYSEKDIAHILFTYGEERRSRRLANAICTARAKSAINTTLELVDIIEKSSPRRKPGDSHPAMRTFMALRIAVNDELNPLAQALTNIVEIIKPAGRIAVITFHSLEDRIVKTVFQNLTTPCTCPRDIPYCACGKIPKLKKITKKPIIPSTEELSENSRAHSAKLRVAERV